jgi:hypothetical protein
VISFVEGVPSFLAVAFGLLVLATTRAVNQLIDYQSIAILIDYFNYQFQLLKLACQLVAAAFQLPIN